MLRVVKVGGSLFDIPELAQRIESWLEGEPVAQTVLVAGGGSLADCVRRWHDTYHLPESLSHTFCIELMCVTAKLLATILDCELVEDLTEVKDRKLVVLQPAAFSPSFDMLEANWDSTSDSIAAAVANLIKADELVLLKSTSSDENMVHWCEWGLVDKSFLHTVENVPVRMVNLREAVSRRGSQNGGITTPRS